MESENNWESKVEAILDIIHPGEWDKRDNEESISSYITYYIYYPEFTIKNSNDQSHKITDFYLRIKFWKERGVLSDVSGMRTTLSQAEKQSGYPHSHLSSSVVTSGQWGGFCFGRGPISKSINRLGSEFNEREFEIFMHGFQVFLEWESLEAGPYQYMADVRKKMGLVDVPIDVKEDTYKRLINKCTELNFTIEGNRNITIPIDDPDLMDQILPLLRNEHTVLRTVRGDFYTTGANLGFDPIKLNFKFKGEQMYQTVYDNETEENGKEYPHPEITEYIAKKLSRGLTLYSFSKRRDVRREAEGHLIGGVMVQDM